MENRFATKNLIKSLSNYPVSKGDVAGHEFHGNQYTASSGSLRDRALQTLKGVSGNGGGAGSAIDHADIADEHMEQAQRIADDRLNGKIPANKMAAAKSAILAHGAAAKAHYAASAASAKVASQSIKPATGTTYARNKMNGLMNAAKDASENASYASANADEMTKAIGQ